MLTQQWLCPILRKVLILREGKQVAEQDTSSLPCSGATKKNLVQDAHFQRLSQTPVKCGL